VLPDLLLIRLWFDLTMATVMAGAMLWGSPG
jgi:hypothetical protein